MRGVFTIQISDRNELHAILRKFDGSSLDFIFGGLRARSGNNMEHTITIAIMLIAPA